MRCSFPRKPESDGGHSVLAQTPLFLIRGEYVSVLLSIMNVREGHQNRNAAVEAFRMTHDNIVWSRYQQA